LALSCLNDNLHKGPNIAGLDPNTGSLTRLFHPRQDIWEEHFGWVGPVLTGRTDIGRTTIDVLAMNVPERLELRRILIRAGLFPGVQSPRK
jgi:hypothetical protein